MKYHPGMTDHELIDWRREMVRRARLLGFSATDIADEIGTTYQNLQNLIKRGSRRSAYAIALDDFLLRKVDDRLAQRDSVDSLTTIAQMTVNAGNMLINDNLSLEVRIRTYLGALQTLEHFRPALVDMLQGKAELPVGNGSGGKKS